MSQSALQIQSPDSCDKLHLPQEVKLVPSTCRYVQHVSGEGLHVRMKARVRCKTGTDLVKRGGSGVKKELKKIMKNLIQ